MVEEVILLALRLRGPAGTEDSAVCVGVEDVKACQRRWQNSQSSSLTPHMATSPGSPTRDRNAATLPGSISLL